jgi:hypothetical protein
MEVYGPHPPLRGTLSRKRERDLESPRPATLSEAKRKGPGEGLYGRAVSACCAAAMSAA